MPPNEEKTEILRVIVLENMSMDIMMRLIGHIIHVTETLMEADQVDLSIWQPFHSSIEKEHASTGAHGKQKHQEARHPMSKGIHRSVC